MSRSNRLHRGFTLVELLVVIGIIALLVSILLPALNKARYQGNIIVCMSNLRQVGQYMALYAAQNKGCVLTGLCGDQQTFKNNVVQSQGQVFVLWGPLFSSGLFGWSARTDGQIYGKTSIREFYCPLETKTSMQFNVSDSATQNLWPPPTTGLNKEVRVGYGLRPTNMEFHPNYGYPIDKTTFFNTPPTKAAWAKSNNFKPNQAWAADYIGCNIAGFNSFISRHPKGINTLYFDYSVQYVPTDVILASWKADTSGVSSAEWTDLDNYRHF